MGAKVSPGEGIPGSLKNFPPFASPTNARFGMTRKKRSDGKKAWHCLRPPSVHSTFSARTHGEIVDWGKQRLLRCGHFKAEDRRNHVADSFGCIAASGG